MSGLRVEEVKYLVHHTVLPPRLPQTDDSCPSHENALLKTVISTLQSFKGTLESQQPDSAEKAGLVVSMMENLLSCRDSHGSVSESQLASLLRRLIRTSSTTIPLNIKAQNAALLISRAGDNVMFEAFELAPRNKDVMSIKGRLIRSFPTVACHVPAVELSKEGFIEALAHTIAKMSSQAAPGLQPQARKAGRNHDEDRDTTHPALVTDFLLTIITAVRAGMKISPQGVSKNTREEVLWSNARSPWRRSTLWLLIRVAMQLEFGRAATNNMYKPFMVFFHSHVLDLVKENQGAMGNEAIHIVSAKLVRRIRKLDSSFKSLPAFQDWMSVATSSLVEAHNAMCVKWKAIANNSDSNVNTMLLDELDPSKDLDINMEELNRFIVNIAHRQSQSNKADFRPTAEYPHYAPGDIPESINGSADYRAFQLAAAEKWIEDCLESWLENSIAEITTCQDILKFLQVYHSTAISAYKELPSSLSIMYLCIFELWIACDKSACHLHPLLGEYDPELQLDQLQALSLPHKSHLVRLSRIEQYVQDRRTRAVSTRPSVMRDFGHVQSFAVKFYNQSSFHQELDRQIVTAAAAQRRQKVQELSDKKEQYSTLMKAYDEGTCDYRDMIIDRYHNITESQHSPHCVRCKKREDASQIGIQVHEWPLSRFGSMAKATVFELRIPAAFSHWRDATNYVAKNVMGFVQDHDDQPRAHYELSNHTDLSTLSAIPYKQRIKILSQDKPHTGTHRKIKSGVTWLLEDDVCLDSGLSYAYYDGSESCFSRPLKPTDQILKQCTYRLPDRSSALQIYVKPRAACLPANRVIAALSECPPHMSVDEYKAFGALPLGYRIQYMNILTQLAMPTVDFAKAETHCLILQTIHEASPLSQDHVADRESHHILSNEAFGLALITELENALGRVTENWEMWRAVAVFVQLAVKLLDFTHFEQVWSRCLAYLGNVRQTCLDWLAILQYRLQTTTDDGQRTELCSRVTEIALLCTTTFDVDHEHVEHVFDTPSAIVALIQSSVYVQENEQATKPEHAFLHRVMLQSWKSTLYRNMPKLLQGIISQRLDSELNEAIKASWNIFTASHYWEQVDSPWSHWIKNKCGTLEVHFNLLTAELLVNGLPLSHLPTKYLQHKMYHVLFGRSSLEVMPTQEPAMDFAAKHAYHGYHLHFGMDKSDMLVVTSNGTIKFDLVPPRLFNDRLPDAFITKYVHWYNRHTTEVELRPKHDPWLSEKTGWRLRKCGSTWRLIKEQATLIDMATQTANALSNIFAPLEKSTHIHITFDHVRMKTLTIEMPRIQLVFYLRCGEHLIRSREYRGMIVDCDQRLGTLNGLSNRLVLIHERDMHQRLVLVPEGTVSFRKTSDHVAVHINQDTSVKVHAYMIDGVLGRITDNGSLQSRLYLAYLHALTSHCLPDLLTGQTGTEAALSILRSGAIMSFGLFTKHDIAILNKIAALSARRRFYPAHKTDMQEVVWVDLPSLSQHSAFFAAVEKIFEQARATRLFYPPEVYVEPNSRTDVDERLLNRDLIRSSTFRVDCFGAECFHAAFDVPYVGRVRISNTNRGDRAFVAAFMILRDENAISSTVNASKLKSVLSSDLLRGSVRGPKSAVPPATLKYDAKWLNNPASLLPTLWCDLQLSLAKSRGQYNIFEVMMWLSTAAFAKDAVMDVIQLLAASYKCPDFVSIAIPSFQELLVSRGDTLDLSSVKGLIQRKSFESSPEYRIAKSSTETNREWRDRKYSAFQGRQNNAVDNFARALYNQWPCACPTKPSAKYAEPYLQSDNSMSAVRGRFKQLYDNRIFGIYLQELCTSMGRQSIVPISIPQSLPTNLQPLTNHRHVTRTLSVQDIFALEAPTFANHGQLCLPKPPTKVNIPLKLRKRDERDQAAGDRLTLLCGTLGDRAMSACEHDYVSDLRKSSDSHCDQQSDFWTRTVNTNEDTVQQLKTYLTHCQRYFEKLNTLLEQVVKSSGDIGAVTHQSPRICATFWLQQLNRDRFETLSSAWKAAVIQYGLAITEIHRAYRLIALSNHPQDLAEELLNCGHRNWSPSKFPETLLLEAESAIMVREVQEEIAKQMRSPPNGENSVMQLNMGEGKSSVIVPIVAAALANTKVLVRVIVAKPQSKQMLQMLVAKLGGLLNRRIYHMPFSRALRLSAAQGNAIHDLYKECMSARGILLVQPEHILSFKLMGIECLVSGQLPLGKSLLRTQQFFDEKARDIVDESDENFSVKFELVYTMGSQRPIELSPGRWLIVQEMMGLLARCAAQVKNLLPDSIEYDDRWQERYPRIRILKDDGGEKLLDLIARHICESGLRGLPIVRLSKDLREAVFRYIRNAQSAIEDIQKVEEGTLWTDSTKDALMLVRGLVGCGVLRFALRAKRWRVNYGIDPNRSPKTNLAVPYRSKDSPSPRSEFSHPDVVLVLTSLTYYYGGLEDDDIFDTFSHLLKSDQADMEYGEWVRTAPCLPEAFRHVGGVNIKDRYQCITEVFPSLRYSTGAIDYFLSHIVFPKEMKEFPQKLSASGWDIGVVKPEPLTGFSGTNDSRHVLPLTVHHLDLPTQQHTNALVLACLLQDENSVQLLPPRTAADSSDAEHLLTIVDSMVRPTRVILDVGAQILELNNLQVAKRWLSMTDTASTEAAVFFNDYEELSVLDRSGKVEPLQTSPFAKQLDVCLVYLDEAHTRGTDLKLPRNYRAAVTLGAHLTKDRLVQACMRMRKLGKGQSVVFCVSEEIQTKILEHTKKAATDGIGVMDVLSWAISETWTDMRRSMPLWATQGHRFEQHNGLLHGTQTTPEQAKDFLEDEAQSIDHRYRPRSQDTTVAAWDMTNDNIAKIMARCQEFGSTNFTSATLQEEQERELSPEIEEERQVQRPPAMQPEKHELHRDLKRLVNTGEFVTGSRAFLPAFEALHSTGAAKFFNLVEFPKDLMVTADYIRTVRRPSGLSQKSFVSDSFQRPIQWVLSVPRLDVPQESQPIRKLVILSPYEANELVVSIQHHANVTLHLYAPRPNMAYTSLDHLQLYTTGRELDPVGIPRTLIVALNLFAGQLYFASYEEYVELCNHLGLATTAAKEGQNVQPDGFILPPAGVWQLTKSPVKFLRDMVTMVRREGESVGKTHLGKMLDGAVLESHDFE